MNAIQVVAFTNIMNMLRIAGIGHAIFLSIKWNIWKSFVHDTILYGIKMDSYIKNGDDYNPRVSYSNRLYFAYMEIARDASALFVVFGLSLM